MARIIIAVYTGSITQLMTDVIRSRDAVTR
jgi:hypothetical protein